MLTQDVVVLSQLGGKCADAMAPLLTQQSVLQHLVIPHLESYLISSGVSTPRHVTDSDAVAPSALGTGSRVSADIVLALAQLAVAGVQTRLDTHLGCRLVALLCALVEHRPSGRSQQEATAAAIPMALVSPALQLLDLAVHALAPGSCSDAPAAAVGTASSRDPLQRLLMGLDALRWATRLRLLPLLESPRLPTASLGDAAAEGCSPSAGRAAALAVSDWREQHSGNGAPRSGLPPASQALLPACAAAITFGSISDSFAAEMARSLQRAHQRRAPGHSAPATASSRGGGEAHSATALADALAAGMLAGGASAASGQALLVACAQALPWATASEFSRWVPACNLVLACLQTPFSGLPMAVPFKLTGDLDVLRNEQVRLGHDAG